MNLVFLIAYAALGCGVLYALAFVGTWPNGRTTAHPENLIIVLGAAFALLIGITMFAKRLGMENG